MLNQQVAQRIKTLCKEKGTSISKMLSACGLSQSYLYEIEKRDKSPRLDTLAKIANYLECSIKDFLP